MELGSWILVLTVLVSCNPNGSTVLQQCSLSAVMDIFRCQPGGAMVPIYFVKHYSRCFCEGIFGMGLIFKSVNLSSIALMWMGPMQSVEGFEKKTDLPQDRKFYQQVVFELQLQPFLGFPAFWSIPQILDLPSLSNHMSQFLNPSIGFPAGSVSLENLTTSTYHVPGIILNAWGL